MDASCLSKDSSYDVVTAITVLEFVCDFDSVVEEMIRCTKPGGRIIIGTLNKLATINQDRIVSNKKPYAFSKMFSPEELRRFLAPFGNVQIRVSIDETIKNREKSLRDTWNKFALPWKQATGVFIVACVSL